MALSPLARLRRVLPDPQVATCDRSTPTVHDNPQTGHSNHAPPDKQVREHRRVERAQPRPELDERFLWFLRLQTAEVRDAVEDRYVGAIEQQLPGEASRG
ncbi:MAG: hypothetical protein QOF84_1570 [Streptomyces sp.]|nr:hypothetical protein [Streptomyces sp.]